MKLITVTQQLVSNLFMAEVFTVVNIGIYCLFSVNSAPTVLNCWYESNGIFLYIRVRFVFVCIFFPPPPGMRCQSHLNYNCHLLKKKMASVVTRATERCNRAGSEPLSLPCRRMPVRGKTHGQNFVYLLIWVTSRSCHGYGIQSYFLCVAVLVLSLWVTLCN